MSDRTVATYESIRDLAFAENLSNRKIKELLYQAGLNDRREEMLSELGREKGPASTPKAVPQLDPEQKAKIEAERAAREQAEAVAAAAASAERNRLASLRLEDGATIWCDAAQNKVRRVVNGYGRKATFDNGGYRIGVKCGELERVFKNTQCPDSFAGECFAVLKSIELAAEHGCKAITVRNDRIGGFEATTKRGYIGAKYLWVAKKIAAEHGMTVLFDQCSGAENLADAVSRKEV